MNFFQNLFKIKNFLLDTVFPIECLGCNKEGLWLCEKCFQTIELNQMQICPLCKRTFFFGQTCPNCQHKTYLDGVLIACSYENKLLDKAIQCFKYKFIESLHAALGLLLIKQIEKIKHQSNAPMILSFSDTILIPIPLHPKRFRERGFNQAELLAREVNKKYNWLIEKNVLQRTCYTPPQVKLTREKRLNNMENAFRIINAEKIKNKNIILIDDVMTTGATFNEATKMLKNHGAQMVWALALARN